MVVLWFMREKGGRGLKMSARCVFDKDRPRKGEQIIKIKAVKKTKRT